MSTLRYTLVTDGASDAALLKLLSWLLREHGVCEISPTWADFRRFPRTGKLGEKIKTALKYYPCELLFIHRDAENELSSRRRAEIHDALEAVRTDGLKLPPTVCVIPVRMLEAWLLFDEQALRRAAGNPSGRVRLEIPGIAGIERVPDPKAVLHQIVRTASELHGRRLTKFSTIGTACRVAEFLTNFAALRELTAFNTLEEEIAQVVREQGWNQSAE